MGKRALDVDLIVDLIIGVVLLSFQAVALY